MYSYATRGLGFLVRCATISRQLGQGRQRSGGSPLFMINHRSSILSIRTTSDKVRMRQMFHVKTWRRCSAHYVYAIAKKEKGSEIDASPQLPISTGVQSLERSRLPWLVPLDRSRLPRSAIMAVQVQSTDVFLEA